ncbi:MAG: hydroxyethylthiazole kinase [Deltaproteobacteria bacterium]|nr:hydroxyethylthiazole kinase [Deltaproteobacteria bacterium]
MYPFLQAVRDKRPLVHHITNWVTIFDCAQIVKSFGASPVMAHAPEEAAAMTGIASALVLNIGTLTTDVTDSMKLAAVAANQKGIPVVFDVCGAGATPYRDQKSLEILDAAKIGVIKGNSSEIARVAGLAVATKGVDAGHVAADMREVARSLSAQRACTVVVTGAEDIVAGDGKLFLVRNGHPMMANVVGTGCMAASSIGTFAAAAPDRVPEATAAGLACFEIAAELAVQKSDGPVAFKQQLFDCVFRLDEKQVESLQRVVTPG